MSVCLSGLDLSFLKDPANRLPEAMKVRRKRAPRPKRSNLPAPYFIGDIAPFVNVANPEKTHYISSRSQLRAFERSFNLRQAGDFKDGEIVAENNAAWQAREDLAKGIESGWSDLD